MLNIVINYILWDIYFILKVIQSYFKRFRSNRPMIFEWKKCSKPITHFKNKILNIHLNFQLLNTMYSLQSWV